MINADKYNHLTSRVEEAESGSLVFYYIWDKNGLQKFKDRIADLSGITFVVNKIIAPDFKNDFITLDPIEWRSEKARLAEVFYPIKSDLIQFAITGTNGKTSTTFLGMQLAKSWSKRSMYIGTLGIYIDNQWVQTNHGFTTPDIIDYRHKVSKYQDRVDVIWIEASSHGLEQGRLDGIMFDGVGWTSFSQDHLDYHETMDKYFLAKKNIFQASKGISFLAEEIKGLEDVGVAPELEVYPSCPFLKIKYNQNNFKLAYALLSKKLGNPSEEIGNQFYVPGRFQTFYDKERAFIIDYAHTPDALERVLDECSKQWPQHKILTVVGCGGDRDKSKRYPMAQIATDKSSYVIFTEDNPRSEKVESIIDDMTKRLTSNNWKSVPDRKMAIQEAVVLDDYKVIVIAGKGEENLIDRGSRKIPHNDYEFIESMF